MSNMEQLLNPHHYLFFGVLGPLGVLGDKKITLNSPTEILNSNLKSTFRDRVIEIIP